MYYRNLLFALLVVLVSCLVACGGETQSSSEAPVNSNTDNSEAISESATAPQTANPELTVNIDQLRLRDRAGEQGKEVTRLAEGTRLEDLGEVSNFTTKVKLRGIQFDEPWLKVRTENGEEGWVYGGAVSFNVDAASDLTRILLEKRLQTTFGADLTTQIQAYRAAYHAAKTGREQGKVYQIGEALAEQLNTRLTESILVENYDQLPDLFWIEDAMPDFIIQLVAEGTTYHLFRDFRTLGAKAASTEGREDDIFCDLNYMLFSQDSIASFFPDWFIQTWDYGGHSLLGQGKHLAILRAADRAFIESEPFMENVLKIKQDLINDILNPIGQSGEMEYWEPQDKILSELDAILATDIAILTQEDRVALETHRKRVADAEANKIKTNFRSGVYY